MEFELYFRFMPDEHAELWIIQDPEDQGKYRFEMRFCYDGERVVCDEKFSRRQAIKYILQECNILVLPEDALAEFPELREISAAVRAAVEKIH